MVILRIEHKVPNFEDWKKAFDSDPIDRRKSAVKRYRIYRPADDPNYAVIDLEFDNRIDDEKALAALRSLWSKVEGTVMFNPQTRIFEVVESAKY
jgi:hypothetical protein